MGHFSDIDFSDSGNDDLNYLDHLAKEDTNMLGILDAIDILTIPEQTKALAEMLELKTGDLTDGQPLGRIFWRAQGVNVTMAELRKKAKGGTLVVLRQTKYKPLENKVYWTRVGCFQNGKQYFNVVEKYVLAQAVFELWKQDEYSNRDLYRKDSGIRKDGILILKRPSFFMKAFTRYVVYITGNQKQTNYEKQHHHSNRKHNVQHEKH